MLCIRSCASTGDAGPQGGQRPGVETNNGCWDVTKVLGFPGPILAVQSSDSLWSLWMVSTGMIVKSTLLASMLQLQSRSTPTYTHIPALSFRGTNTMVDQLSPEERPQGCERKSRKIHTRSLCLQPLLHCSHFLCGCTSHVACYHRSGI